MARVCPIRTIRHNGQVRTIAEWAKITGISHELIGRRLTKGYSAEKCLAPTIPQNGRMEVMRMALVALANGPATAKDLHRAIHGGPTIETVRKGLDEAVSQGLACRRKFQLSRVRTGVIIFYLPNVPSEVVDAYALTCSGNRDHFWGSNQKLENPLAAPWKRQAKEMHDASGRP